MPRELKYKRIPYTRELSTTYKPVDHTLNYNARVVRYNAWKKENTKIEQMTLEELEKVDFRVPSSHGIITFKTIGVELDDAMVQVQKYAKKLRTTESSVHVNEETPVYWAVLMGIGSRVIMGHNYNQPGEKVVFQNQYV